jgi:hypothetical protein
MEKVMCQELIDSQTGDRRGFVILEAMTAYLQVRIEGITIPVAASVRDVLYLMEGEVDGVLMDGKIMSRKHLGLVSHDMWWYRASGKRGSGF